MAGVPVPTSPEAITCEWLSEALATKVESFDCEQIGIGVGLLGRLYRITLSSDGGPKSVIAKFPTLDEGARMHVVEPLNFYEKEIRFYSEAASGTPVATPQVYVAHFDATSRDFALLLEDLGSRRMEDQIAGCSLADAETAVDALVELHAKWWEADFPSWLPAYSDPPYPQVLAGMYKQAWPKALEVFGDHLSSELREFGERYPDLLDFFMGELGRKPWTLCHGDFRLDNLFFGVEPDHADLTAVDWQICFRGRGGYDLAYFVSQSVPAEVRRPNEKALKDRYREGLAAKGIDYPADELERDYKRTVAYCFIYPVVSAGQIELTNDRMLGLILGIGDRAVQAILDNDALSVLPT